jgi:hypothetical protein
MNRRDLLKSMAFPAAGALLNSARALFAAQDSDADVAPATGQTPLLATYQILRFGCSFHFSTPTFTGDDYDAGDRPASV